MMIRFLILVFIFNSSLSLFAQSPSPYQWYTSTGKKTSYKKLVKECLKKELVLFGEEHNNAIAHWLQLRLTKDLAVTKPLVLGAEMIERDNQDELEAYLAGSITQKQFDSTARLWSNHHTDYAPLVDFAKINKFDFIGTNIPRRYASQVARGGFEILDKLSDEEKSWIAPLPILYDAELPGYKNMIKMMGGHGGPNLPKAQAVKDATMAHFLVKHLKPNHIFIHYHGTYHSQNHEGIVWYVKQSIPTIKYLTIATVTQKDIKSLQLDNTGLADFILCVDEDMTRTY